MYAQVAPSVPEPDLIVWLQATPATLLQRIQQRGIAMEQGIGEDYLQRLCDAYVEHFHSHAGAPVFGVVTERFNPVDNNADFDLLLDKLSTFEGRRGIYDPAA